MSLAEAARGDAAAGHEALLGDLLAGLADDLFGLLGLGDGLGALLDDELDVRGRGHVGTNAP